MWEKTKVMRIPREPSPLQIVTDQKELENVEYFNYLGSMVTNDARCTGEIESRLAMTKTGFNRKKTVFTSKLDLNCIKLKEETSEVLHLEHSIV
jgi:hypothetical protein